jgi:HD superfamily phosphohydrolase
MEIRDVIHKNISVSSAEKMIIESPFFQRLRNIKQLGFGENAYPGATHNRYIHSLGAMHLAGAAFERAFAVQKGASLATRYPEAFERFSALVRASALLHDIGHGPLSHTSEFAMPSLESLALQIPGANSVASPEQQADHEDYTLKIILESSLTPILKRALGYLGIDPLHIACVLNPDVVTTDQFFTVGGVNFRPILNQLVSSELDVDRMDYLSRDSFYAGVSYGNFDLSWILSHLTHHIADNQCYLALNHKAIYTFDDFLISRYHMFLMVYFHHKCIIFDEMLSRYLTSDNCAYRLPSNIEDYIYFDDYHLYTHLSQSDNPWAKRIFHKNPYRMLVEFHSGIPYGEQYQEEQKAQLQKIIDDLENKGKSYIVKTTNSEFSKYFRRKDHHPLFVKYDINIGIPRFIPIHECTDLFDRYENSRSITRVYTEDGLA